MSVLIRGMKMPTTGLYIVSVDNTNGRDKTIATVERMLDNRDMRHIVGLFELVSVPPHGKLIDADMLNYTMLYKENWMSGTGVEAPAVWKKDIDACPAIIEAEES